MKQIYAWILGAAALLLVLLTHRSSEPAILARYSVKYFSFLTLYAVGIVCVAWLVRGERGPALAARIRTVAGARFGNGFFARHQRLLLVLTFVAHIALLARVLPLSVLASGQPILNIDYAHHYHQVEVVDRAIAEDGKSWAYDPSFCAGYPEGTLFDLDMKLFEVIAYPLTRAGLSLPVAFNLVLVVFLLAVPFLLWLTCRNFRFSPPLTLLVVASGVLLWHGQPYFMTFTRAGMCGFVEASYWTVFTLSVFDRFLDKPGLRWALALCAALAVAFPMHVVAVVLLAGPMLVAYAMSFRTLPVRGHFLFVAAVSAAVAVNLWWIVTLWHFLPWRVHTTMLQPDSLTQWLSNVLRVQDDGFILAVLGVWGFLTIRSTHRRIAYTGVAAIVWYFVLAYLTYDIPALRNLESRRFIIPGSLVSMMGLSAGLFTTFQRMKAARSSLPAFPFVVPLVALLLRTEMPQEFTLPPMPNERAYMKPLADWIETNTDRSGRIAFMDLSPGAITGSKLHFFVSREVIGGPFSQVNLVHSYAGFHQSRFFDKRLQEVTEEDVRFFVEQYNIKWLIATTDEGDSLFRRFHQELRPRTQFVLRWGEGEPESDRSPFARFFRPTNECPVSIFDVIGNEPSWFLEGSGDLHADQNRIVIKNAAPGRTVVKYHWLPTFAVDPPLPIRMHPVERSPIGFIEVDNGDVKDFTIYNSYRWPAK